MPDPSQAPDPDRTARRRRVRYNAAMKWARRAHMYAGLFLAPWVFLYGVSAFLFNHPDAFSDREVRSAPLSESGAPAIEGMPDAETIAARVVAALDARAGGGGDRYRLASPAGATLSRPLTITATGPGREHAIRYDLDSGTAVVRSSSTRGEGARGAPDGEVVHLDDPPRERLARGATALLGRLGIAADSAVIRNPPDLIFERRFRRRPLASRLQPPDRAALVPEGGRPRGRDLGPTVPDRAPPGLRLPLGLGPALGLGPDRGRDGLRDGRLGGDRPGDVVADEVAPATGRRGPARQRGRRGPPGRGDARGARPLRGPGPAVSIRPAPDLLGLGGGLRLIGPPLLARRIGPPGRIFRGPRRTLGRDRTYPW